MKIKIEKALGWLEYLSNKNVEMIKIKVNDEVYLVPNVVLEKIMGEVVEEMRNAENQEQYEDLRETLRQLQVGEIHEDIPWNYIPKIIEYLGIPLND